MIDLIIVAFAAVAVTGTVAIFSYEFGRRSRGSIVAMVSETTMVELRIDADCSPADALKFLDYARVVVARGEFRSHSEKKKEFMPP